MVFASGREGYATLDPDVYSDSMQPLFETILSEIPAPSVDEDGPTQVLISSLDYDDYVGRIGIGRVERGGLTTGQQVVLCRTDGRRENVKVSRLYQFRG